MKALFWVATFLDVICSLIEVSPSVFSTGSEAQETGERGGIACFVGFTFIMVSMFTK